ncbi:MAG: alpha/beta fold hydrolase [bacterium]
MSSDYKRLPNIQMVTIGSQKLRTAIWEGTSDKTPILFFNGIGANLEIAQPMAEMMPDRTLITFDLPGVGGSPDPTFIYRAWWVARAAKKILQGFNVHKVDVIGVSWGGGMAQQFAFQYRKTVNRLVLAATSPGVFMVPGDIAAMSKMSSPKRYQDPEFLAAHFETLYGDDANGAPAFLENMTPPSIRGYLFQLAAMAGWSSLPFLPFLPHKTLVLSGDRDNIVPLANGKILKCMIPNAQLYVFENSGHMFMLSKGEEFLSVLVTFLDSPSETANDDLSVSTAIT